jgi:hypothetical protein
VKHPIPGLAGGPRRSGQGAERVSGLDLVPLLAVRCGRWGRVFGRHGRTSACRTRRPAPERARGPTEHRLSAQGRGPIAPHVLRRPQSARHGRVPIPPSFDLRSHFRGEVRRVMMPRPCTRPVQRRYPPRHQPISRLRRARSYETIPRGRRAALCRCPRHRRSRRWAIRCWQSPMPPVSGERRS